MKAVLTVYATLALLSSSSQAGVFLKIDRAVMEYAPFIVVHPFGYDGANEEIVLKICPNDPDLGPAVRESIGIWNDLMPSTENCDDCFLIEDGPSAHDPTAPFDLTSVLLHELGHCAMGLGHTNWPGTSYTATQDAVAIDEGADLIRGSLDDSATPFPGSRVVHWFRETDNNPVVIDSVVIDANTYSRRFQDFPAGNSWPASANRDVALALGYPDTHSLMYSEIRQGSRYSALDADTVNTVRFAMTGIDSTAGTGDDYTIRLDYHGDCESADIVIDFFTPTDPGDTTVGACVSEIEQINENNTVHYRITQLPEIGEIPLIEISDQVTYDVIFVGDFEIGNLDRWSEAAKSGEPENPH